MIATDFLAYRVGINYKCTRYLSLGLNVLFSTLWLGAFVVYLYELSNSTESFFSANITPQEHRVAAVIIAFCLLACIFWVC